MKEDLYVYMDMYNLPKTQEMEEWLWGKLYLSEKGRR